MPVKLFEFDTTLTRHLRRYCECCGFPSLSVPDVDAQPYNGDPRPDLSGVPGWETSNRHCELCEWESQQLDAQGDPVSVLLEEPNDGITLEQARANFARFGSIYDPSNLPDWKVSVPSPDVQEARRALREAYEVLMATEPDARKEPWNGVTDAERYLHAALEAQQAADEEQVADEWDDDAEPST